MPEKKYSARYPTDLPAWQKLKKHYREDMHGKPIGGLFSRDKNRTDRFSAQGADIHLDYSKNLLSANTVKHLLALAKQAKVTEAVDGMFAGEKINSTENRSVLHVALRAKISDQVALNVNGVMDIWKVLTAMESFADRIHGGELRGSTGKKLTNIVNIGIGGSDLGLVMATRALRHYWLAGMRFYEVSNVDGTQFADLQEQLDPEATLFVVCSKTFTTLETMTNAQAAREWMSEKLGEAAIASHFVAASTNHEAMDKFGVHPEFRFGFWEWVGGRYSIWSAVGLALILMIGMENFRSMLDGARRMDQHFRQSTHAENIPVLMALMGVWYNNFAGASSHAILPYDNRLERFPAFLQQMQMESNGKSVRLDGKPVKTETGMVIWGEAGSNAQHSFYQLLHQGTRTVPVDFILPAQSSGATQKQQDLAIANCLAQSEALMDGFSLDEAGGDPHRVHRGSRPSSTLLMPELSPSTLGQLVALYEHKVFVEGVIWGVNSFDQWGVELGKRLANGLIPAASKQATYTGSNRSTDALLRKVSQLKDS